MLGNRRFDLWWFRKEKNMLTDLNETMRWIPVSKRLPEDYQDCLVIIYEDWSNGKGIDVNLHLDLATFYTDPDNVYIWCKDKEGVCGFGSFYNDWVEGQTIYITHWMPMPKPADDEE